MNVQGIQEIRIEDIKGFKIGHATHVAGGTGCTAIICEEGAVAGCEVRGGGPATRETPLLDPLKNAHAIHCLMLSGGSAYGLAACDGAMSYLEEHGIGYKLGPFIIPLVVGASIFDLAVGEQGIRPDKGMGYGACEDAFNVYSACGSINEQQSEGGESNIDINAGESDHSETTNKTSGNVGAGTGATVGKINGPAFAMKSGLGIYAAEIEGVKVGAIAVVNALGDVLENGKIIAGALIDKGEEAIKKDDMVKNNDKAKCSEDQKNNDMCSGVDVGSKLMDYDQGIFADSNKVMLGRIYDDEVIHRANTTLACVITDAKLTKTQANKVAQVMHNALAGSISPVHTAADGDSTFCLAYGTNEVNADVFAQAACEITKQAIVNAVKSARPAYGLPAYSSFHK